MSAFSNIDNLTIIGSTINIVAGNQINPGNPVKRVTLPLNRNTLPRLTRMFTGRTDVLVQMSRYFIQSRTSTQMQRIFVLYGLGGGGKTQVMLKFVDEFGDQFSKVHFVNASTLATIQSGLEDIARNASVGESADSALDWLCRERSEWLLLFDNADDPTIDLEIFFPDCKHGNIIVTTRNKECRALAPESHCGVSGMKPEDAIELLIKKAMITRSDETHRLCAEIVHELGYLALAVSQAGAYIARSSCLGTYLQIYNEDRAELLCRHSVQNTGDYEWTVYTTWETSLKKLTPTAAMLLRICSFMHYDGISKRIFENAAANEDGHGSFPDGAGFLQNFRCGRGKWSDIRFTDLVNELTSYSLIDVNSTGDVYSFHPLVHAWARDRTNAAEKTKARACAMQILALLVTDDNTAEAHMFHRTLLPHVDRIRADVVEAAIAARLQKIYWEAGRWKGREELLRVVMEAREKELGFDHPLTLAIASGMAWTYRGQGRQKEAEALMIKVMEARRRVLGDEHPDTLRIMSNLGWTYAEQGRWNEAEELMTRTIEARKRVIGDEHPETLTTKNYLAWTFTHQGRWQEAEELHLNVLESMQRVLGNEHRLTLLAQRFLGRSYSLQGRLTEAEALYISTIETSQRALGQEHPDTLAVMSDLANTYSRQGRWEEAEALEETVVEARIRLLGNDHPHTQDSIFALTEFAERKLKFQSRDIQAATRAL